MNGYSSRALALTFHLYERSQEFSHFHFLKDGEGAIRWLRCPLMLGLFLTALQL